MIILYKELLATGRTLFASRSLFKISFSQLALFHVRVTHRISSSVAKAPIKWHVLAATPVGIFLCGRLTQGVVQCKARSSASQQLLLRKANRIVSSSNVVKFNWRRLVDLMRPDFLLLVGAVVVSGEGDSLRLGFYFLVRNSCCHCQYTNTTTAW